MMTESFLFSYSTHHNWRWVIHLATEDFLRNKEENNLQLNHCERFSSLPSLFFFPFLRPVYSLIRVDLLKERGGEKNLLKSIRMSSLALSYMDAKDKLVRDLLEILHQNEVNFLDITASARSISHYMPQTLLLPWNISFSSPDSLPELPSYPSLLKAPLGSGGYGLYFVYSKVDLAEILRCQRERALKEEGFIERLHQDPQYQKAPLSWSLQEYLTPIEAVVPLQVEKNEILEENQVTTQGHISSLDSYMKFEKIINGQVRRRTQVRGYIIEKSGELYMHEMLEVRCPLWSFDLETKLNEEQKASDCFYSSRSTPCEKFKDNIEKFYSDYNDKKEITLPLMPRSNHWDLEIEEECCGLGNARPYNVDRLKNKTLRYLFDELNYPSSRSSVESPSESTTQDWLDKEILKKSVYSKLSETFKLLKNKIKVSYEEDQVIKKKNLEDLIEKFNKKHNKIGEDAIKLSDLFDYLSLESNLGILGVDLLVYETVNGEIESRIVEVNYNPAMAGEMKNMSDSYRNHLKEFVQSLIVFSFASSNMTLKDLPWSEKLSERLLKSIKLI